MTVESFGAVIFVSTSLTNKGEPSWSDIGMRIVEGELGETYLVNVCEG
jgi:hypothetical protein